jgi:hypothetical protein
MTVENGVSVGGQSVDAPYGAHKRASQLAAHGKQERPYGAMPRIFRRLTLMNTGYITR